jgi:hypothetical protein
MIMTMTVKYNHQLAAFSHLFVIHHTTLSTLTTDNICQGDEMIPAPAAAAIAWVLCMGNVC